MPTHLSDFSDPFGGFVEVPSVQLRSTTELLGRHWMKPPKGSEECRALGGFGHSISSWLQSRWEWKHEPEQAAASGFRRHIASLLAGPHDVGFAPKSPDLAGCPWTVQPDEQPPIVSELLRGPLSRKCTLVRMDLADVVQVGNLVLPLTAIVRTAIIFIDMSQCPTNEEGQPRIGVPQLRAILQRLLTISTQTRPVIIYIPPSAACETLYSGQDPFQRAIEAVLGAGDGGGAQYDVC